MKGMQISWRTDLHTAQKAEFWGEGTEEMGNRVQSFLFLALVKYINSQQFWHKGERKDQYVYASQMHWWCRVISISLISPPNFWLE